MTQKRETVGKISSELLGKSPDSVDPIEIERAMHGDYSKNMFDCWSAGRSSFHGDFFIVVITKREPLMPNVLRNYFFSRVSCPTPDYDQTVYHYKKNDDVLDFLWVIPSKDACIQLSEQATSVAPEEWGLLNYVLRFADGSLYKIAKKLNGEAEDSILLVQ